MPRLSDYIYALQEGAIDGATSNPHDLMRRMVEKYASSTPDVSTSATDGNGRTGTQGKTVVSTIYSRSTRELTTAADGSNGLVGVIHLGSTCFTPCRDDLADNMSSAS